MKNNIQTIITFNMVIIIVGIFIFINSFQLSAIIFPYLDYTEFLFSFFSLVMIVLPTANTIIIFLTKYTKNLTSIDEKSENKFLEFKPLDFPIIPFIKINNLKEKNTTKNFNDYFTHIINHLESKSSDADKKASILLDNGKFYSMIGIFYFIISIVGWQYYLNKVGFETHHIYGIVSSSLVFIFIEFLSAWYLRQYKSFSDTSTYLTKIKSIFDKYMLIYLISKESENQDFTTLLEQLASEIKWPETYLLKNADLSFAKEAMETMTTMAKAFKKEIKN
ncbi:hypothetical protein AS4_28550 [Acinetobacter guillouiae]|uniref:hypothetical protein n=1 Tax=Acinetobacter guillouiae TaxID=106649 RepID=UPI0004EF6682|nr:hypothetical protein [Acinetobacter guillouiae]BAP37795.1 hypothetical protein AS4_28550 [Acinetobacter guillouiae]